ncbi:MAG: hypothetical protein ACRCXL_00535 [Dermatophilaceae bacterium]
MPRMPRMPRMPGELIGRRADPHPPWQMSNLVPVDDGAGIRLSW